MGKDKEPKGDKWTKRVEKSARGSSSPGSKSDQNTDPVTPGSQGRKGRTVAKGNDGDRYVVKHDDGWAVKKEHAERASGVFRTQKEAIDRAREIVDKTSRGDGDVRIQGRDGKFRDSDSGRNNESSAKDTK